nr:SDR family NAD(P)-dependent oxidoreductase [Paenibacillus polysaccharolyticus]
MKYGQGSEPVEKVYKHVVENIASGKIDKVTGIQVINLLKQEEANLQEDIAVIGMSLKFPHANGPEEYWHIVEQGIDCIGNYPLDRKAVTDDYLRLSGYSEEFLQYLDGAFLDDVDQFDYKFFRLSPKEASLMDPCHRLFLQTAWHAIEDAGYGGQRLVGSNTGIFTGFANSNNYKEMIKDVHPEELSIAMTGNIASMLPTRISYLLNLKGPTMVVDTACSSSLVSVYLACKSLMNGDCSMAIAGGVKLDILPVDNDFLKIGIESTDYRTRAFDTEADGSGMGEGVAAVILKPLRQAQKDGDHIYGVIKGIALNQDGTSMGITAPNPVAQSEVIEEAWRRAGIHPESLAYIETHGTGTNLGDPIEIQGLERAFRKHTSKKQFCAIGSVKTNVGHLYETAGMASLIKGLLSLYHQKIPPSLHFNRPNLNIDFGNSPVYVNTRLRDWEQGETPRRCGISTFGLSGTNCHLVLEEAPAQAGVNSSSVVKANLHPFTISAGSDQGVQTLIQQHLDALAALQHKYSLMDVCRTANACRGHYAHRLVILAEDMNDLIQKLKQVSSGDVHSFTAPWLQYGEHRLINDNRTISGPHDITQKSVRALNEEVKQELTRIHESVFNLERICTLYVQGAAVDWRHIYEGQSTYTVPLPGYPFDLQKCWIDMGHVSNKESVHQEEGLYAFSWREIEEDTDANELCSGDRIVLFTGEHNEGADLAHYLQEMGKNVILVHPGECFEHNEPFKFYIGSEEDQFDALVNALGEGSWSQVIFEPSFIKHTGIQGLEELNETQQRGVYSLFYLVRALNRHGTEHDVDLVILTRDVHHVTGKEQVLRPELATLEGLAKVIRKEHLNLQCRVMDLEDMAWNMDNVKYVLRRTEHFLTAIRDGKTYVQSFGPIGTAPDLESDMEQNPALHSDGVYLISGGAGGIGIEVSKYLAGRANVHLAWINRSALPPRNTWEDLLQADEDRALCRKIQSILDIESMGSTIEIYSADISKKGEIQPIVDELRRQHGKIRGVIHGAGIGRSDLLINRSESQFKGIFDPKVLGTRILDELTSSDKLDFFILFSSVATMFSGAVQGDYTAANAYLDAYGEYRNKLGKRTHVINWTTWKETGMALEGGFTIDTIFKTLPTRLAIEGLQQILSRNIPRALVGYLNYENGGVYLLEKSGVLLSSDLVAQLEVYKEKKKQEKAAKAQTAAVNSGGEVNLIGSLHHEFSDTEKRVAECCRKILGFDQIDIHDNFFELGADSILLMKIQGEIERIFPGAIDVTDLFEYSNVHHLAKFISGKNKEQGQRPSPALKSRGMDANERDGDIAIIGMAVNVPLASTPEELWQHLVNGTDLVRSFPESRKADIDKHFAFTNPNESQMKYNENAYLEEIDKFDAGFFRLSPKEASLMDPNQRLFLEAAWTAIEDAGYGGTRLKGSKTGVYLGYAATLRDLYARLLYEVDPGSGSSSMVGNLTAMMSARISYLLDLKGPNMVIDTACSSSLVSVDMACKAIRSGQCDYALAGGIKINLCPVDDENMKLGIESTDHRSKAFDDYADGAGIGEGVAVVFLKSLQQALDDHDSIHAVIKGGAVNQDGSSIGITAPNPASQTEVIISALEDAGVEPETIGYIETHGTGTTLGDPIEIKGISDALSSYTDRKQFCAVSSIKTNMGHSSEAAGVISLVKATMALREKKLPPTLFFNRPNRMIEFSNSPVFVNTRLREWNSEEGPRRCGISAFGISGTNCHVILEEAPVQTFVSANQRRAYVLPLSAKSRASLIRLIAAYRDYLQRGHELDLLSMCATAALGRGHYKLRVAIPFNDRRDLISRLDDLAGVPFNEIKPPVAYASEHRMIPDNKEPEVGELTERKLQQLNERAERLLGGISEGLQEEHLEEISMLYIQGADIEWSRLYAEEETFRLHLPTYPYERTRCWISVPERFAVQPSFVPTEEPTMHYTTGWVKGTEPERLVSNPQTVLLLKGASSLCNDLSRELSVRGTHVIEVTLGETYAKISPVHYQMDGSEEQYLHLLKSTSNHRIDQIIHAFTLNGSAEPESPYELETVLSQGVHSLFYLTKAIAGAGLRNRMRIVLLSRCVHEINGQESRLAPEHATMFGLGKAIGQEHPQLECKAIDMDEHTNISMLINGMNADEPFYLTAYRNSERYMEEFRKMDLDRAELSSVAIQEQGVYVITGGMGGIGRAFAEHFANQHNVTIILAGRSDFPQRDKWQAILDDGRNHSLCEKIRWIQLIESKGSTLACYSVDISDLEQVTQFIEKIRGIYGRIHGVVHGAGVAGEGFLASKSVETFNKVLLPKVQGTWNMDRATSDEPLDFLVLFSTTSTLFSSPGQGDYSAANSYLDAYAAYRNRKGGRTLTINWVAWKETGMAKDFGVNDDMVFKSVMTRSALRAFDQVLQRKVERSIIGELNYDSEYMAYVDDMTMMMSEEVYSNIQEKSANIIAEVRMKQASMNKEVALSGRNDGQYTVMEQMLSRIWSIHLGLSEIDLYDDFYEYGGDSIIGLKMASDIYRESGIQVNPSDVLQYPTIWGLGAYLQTLEESEDVVREQSIIPHAEVKDIYALSSAQKRIFYLCTQDPDNISYNLNKALIMEGNFDPITLNEHMNILIQRHESFRTSFHWEQGEPIQKIHDHAELIIETLPGVIEGMDAIGTVVRQFIRPFDLEAAPLIRMLVGSLEDGRHLLMFDVHHLITDGTSMDIMMQEITSLYSDSPLPDIPYQYRDYAEWSNKYLQSDRMKVQENFWLETLKEPLPVLQLPTDYPRPDRKTYDGAKLTFYTDQTLTTRISQIGAQTGTTLYMLLLSALNVLLHKYTNQSDILIGSPVTGRQQGSFDATIGMFVNTIVLRNEPLPNDSFRELLLDVKQRTLSAFAHQDCQFDRIVQLVNSKRDPSRNPLFDVYFALQNVGMYAGDIQDFKGTLVDYDSEISRFDLALDAIEREGVIEFILEYNTSLFMPETAEQIALDYVSILEIITKQPDVLIYDIELDRVREVTGDAEDEEVHFNF